MSSQSNENHTSCFFNVKVKDVICKGNKQDLKYLLTKDGSNDFNCRSELEFLLLRSAYYDLPHVNLYGYTICDAHHEFLTKKFRRDRCHLCKIISGITANSTHDLRRIPRTIAYGIWKDLGLSIFDQTMCGGCRKKLQKKYFNKEIIEQSESVFTWLYDEYTIYTPSTNSSSQHSLYQLNEDPDIELDERDNLKQFLVNSGFQGRVQITKSYQEMLPKSQKNFLHQTKLVLLFILQLLAPNDFHQLWEDLIESEIEETKNTYKIDGQFGIVMGCIADAYNNAEHWSTRRQILSVVARDVPLYVVQEFIPDVTIWKFKTAKEQAVINGRGCSVNIDQSIKIRYTEEQIAHFIQYILSPHITTDMPFGEKTIKLSTGDTIVIPNTIRNLLPSRIIQAYKEYCKECDEDFKPLGDVCLFKILQGCSASTRKSLQGLDYFACDGSNAFDSLQSICDELTAYDVHISKSMQLKKALHESRNYLKNNYKLHVQLDSNVMDHCINYGLSDANESSWKDDCIHSHDMECDQCLLLKTTLNELYSTIDTSNMTPTIKSRYIHRFNKNQELIWDWKAHLMRCVQQDNAKIDVLDNLQDDSVLVLLDWAMKWIPLKYREAQRDFFGNILKSFIM